MAQRSSSSTQMSGKQRILAALQRQPVDRLPFVPLIDTYSVLDMPAHVQQAIQTAASAGLWQGMQQAIREIGCDIMLRHVYVTEAFGGAPHLSGLGRFLPPVEASSRMEGQVLVETLATPVGALKATWGFTDRHGWIPHPLKHLVGSHEELKVFAYAVEHLSPEPPAPDYGNFRHAEEALGDTGLATTSFLNTPLMHLIETFWGLESTYYLLHDYPDEVQAILDGIHRSQLRIVERIAASPARVAIEYENTSSTLLSPDVLRRYCLPYIRDYARILHAADKIYLLHCCGKLRAFVNELAELPVDGIVDLSPEPTGNLPLDEAAARFPGKVVVGGIDATTFVDPDLQRVEAQLVPLIRRLRGCPGVLLGSADTAPRGTPLATFRLIQHLVETVGAHDEAAARYRPGAFLASLAAAEPRPPAEPAPTPSAPAGEPDMHVVLQELARRLDGKRPDVSGVIKFAVTDDAVYRLFIVAGKCRIEAGDGTSDAGITANSKNLLALFTGKLSSMAAFMTRKCKFDGNLQLLGVLAAARE
jgi:hypothetical protein